MEDVLDERSVAKRAVWYLAEKEILFSLILGRTSCVKSDTIDLELPLPLADDALSRYCSDHPHPTPFHLSPESQSHASSSTRDRAPINTSMIFHQRFGIALQKLFAVRMSPSSRVGERDKDAIVALAREIDNFFTKDSFCIPWDPTIVDTVHLVSAGKLTCLHLFCRILLHRLLIFEEPGELQLCFQSANELIDVLDHLRTRGVFEHTAAWAPYATVPATSLLLFVACNECHEISAANRANAWVGIHRCISVLNTLGQISSLAAQLQKRLEQIIQTCVTNELFPLSSEGLAHGHQKRDATEVLETFNVASEASRQRGKRPSSQEQGPYSFDFPDGVPAFFPIWDSPNSIETTPSGLPYLRNPWARFDASLFQQSGKPTKSPTDGNLDPSVWMPPYIPSDVPLEGSSSDFSFDNFDLSHSFII